jgi:GrpB-like predicted nucleotidyltransferase (UPF0157 family)
VADERIVVVPYDPEWPTRFAAERTLLERVLAHGLGAASTTSARHLFLA